MWNIPQIVSKKKHFLFKNPTDSFYRIEDFLRKILFSSNHKSNFHALMELTIFCLEVDNLKENSFQRKNV